MRSNWWLILAAIWLCPQAVFAVMIPACAGRVAVAQAPVMRVQRSGVLMLAQGRAVILEGILLPQAADDGRLLADSAFVALSRMADEGSVTFAVTPPDKDRYGRLRAQAFGTVWVQRALLEQGLARVMIAPDRTNCAAQLYKAEALARDAKRGLWTLPAYRVRAADAALKDDAGTFQIVEGVVANVGRGDGHSFIDFDREWRNGFSAVIAGEDRKTFRRAGFDLQALKGRRIRLRGMVRENNGQPQILLANPAQVELLDKP
jgi:hypothetical protein